VKQILAGQTPAVAAAAAPTAADAAIVAGG
jgi:hypothetical protein